MTIKKLLGPSPPTSPWTICPRTPRSQRRRHALSAAVRGDPLMRGQLFPPQKTPSLLDKHIDAVHDLMVRLMRGQRIFHIKIHYSSFGRCSLWLLDDLQLPPAQRG